MVYISIGNLYLEYLSQYTNILQFTNIVMIDNDYNDEECRMLNISVFAIKTINV